MSAAPVLSGGVRSIAAMLSRVRMGILEAGNRPLLRHIRASSPSAPTQKLGNAAHKAFRFQV